jgi:hypothetical protein
VDRAAGDAELAGDLEQAHARELAQCRDEASVKSIDGHLAQYFRRLRVSPARIALLR